MGDIDLNSRFTLYSQSIDAFVNNVFIGSFGENKVGEHSTWLDMLGLYGLLSILLFIYLFNVYKFSKKRISQEGNTIFNIIWFYFIILGIINTVLFSKIFLTLFIIIPLSINLIYDNDKRYEEMDIKEEKLV